MITRMTMVCRSAAPLVTSGERTQAGILQTSVILSRWTPTTPTQSQYCSVISPPPPASLDIKASTQLQRDLFRSPSSGEKKTPVSEIKWNFRSNHGFQCPSDLQLHSISLYYNKLQVDNQVMLVRLLKGQIYISILKTIGKFSADHHLSFQSGSLLASHPGFDGEERVEHIFPSKFFCVAFTTTVLNSSINLIASPVQGDLIFRGCLDADGGETFEENQKVPIHFGTNFIILWSWVYAQGTKILGF